MIFNPIEHRAQLQNFPEYIATGKVLNDYIWKTQKYGRLLLQKSSSQPLNMVVVGRVDAYRFNCGPAGTCFKLDVAGLEKSKQQFHLGKPSDEPFAGDFNRAIAVLEKFQSATAKSSDKKNLIVNQYDETMVRFMHRLFNKRVMLISASFAIRIFILSLHQEKPIPRPQGLQSALDDIENPSQGKLVLEEEQGHIDTETDLWPVPPHLADELDRIKYNFTVNPLPVYKDDEFISPSDVETCLDGALVEVTFNLEHYAIFKHNEIPHDTFDADVLQINILKDADKTPLSAFKLHNVHDGPIRLHKRGAETSAVEEPAAKKTKEKESE